MINEEFKQAIESGSNIFLSGSAGTGKSYQIDRLIEQYPNKNIALTATTGLAAVNISGQTLHSFLNLGIFKTNNIAQIVNGTINNPYSKWEHVMKTDILVIDECSMLDGFMFEIVEEILRKIKGNREPFGGIQVVLVGDLFQLPPVQVKDNGYFFNSESYNIGRFKPIILTKIYRQNDDVFTDCLNRIRIGEYNQDDIPYLRQRQFPELNYALLDTTCLFSTNKEADYLNTYRLNAMKGKEICLESEDVDYSSQMSLFKRDFNKNFRVPSLLTLKAGCRIILLSNYDVDSGICNGSIGTFEGKGDGYIQCKFKGRTVRLEPKTFELYEKDKLIYSRTQYPIRLGYGITIHASQGMSLDSVAIDFSKVFAPGMAYVALSRCRSIDGLYLKNLSSNIILTDTKIVNFMKGLGQCQCKSRIAD